jgi:SAM-dependent methyltransferase
MSPNLASTPRSQMYSSGEFLEKHPTWNVEDSRWKTEQILKMLKKHNIMPQTICEVGCGAGEVLRQLQAKMTEDCKFVGYEISPQALELCKERANEKLRFELKDITQEADDSFDVLLFNDVIEHVEDYLGFLRSVRKKARYKIFHIPLEFTAVGALRGWPVAAWREYGELHSFMKDTALESLRDAGYAIIEFNFTRWSDNPTPSHHTPLILKLLRKVTFPISNDLSVRLFGGCELLVLAE